MTLSIEAAKILAAALKAARNEADRVESKLLGEIRQIPQGPEGQDPDPPGFPEGVPNLRCTDHTGCTDHRLPHRGEDHQPT